MDEPRLDNPYASPQAEESSGDAPSWDAWNDAGVIVTPPKSALPMRCVVCNAPARHQRGLRRTGWISSQGVTNVVVGLWFCDRHHQRQGLAFLMQVVGGMLLMLMAPQLGYALIGFGGFLTLMLACLVIGLVARRSLIHWAGRFPTVQRASPTAVRIKGCGSEFADSLPDTPP